MVVMYLSDGVDGGIRGWWLLGWYVGWIIGEGNGDGKGEKEEEGGGICWGRGCGYGGVGQYIKLQILYLAHQIINHFI